MQTLLLNLYGAPSSGKSVKMLQLAALAKCRGLFAEICPEVAKEYVVQHIPISAPVQRELSAEQTRRMLCFAGNVDLLITDAPPLIGAFYAHHHALQGAQDMTALFQSYRRHIAAKAAADAPAAPTVNVYIWRNHPYDPRGRIESGSEDTIIANSMWSFVKTHHAHEPLLQARSTDSPDALLDRILAAAHPAARPRPAPIARPPARKP
jgi:hypothetical protein